MSGGSGATQATLEKELEGSIECLRQLGIMLEGYKPENEAAFFDKINTMIEYFRRVYAAKDAVTEMVPLAVIKDYLDKGLDPDLYTKHRLEHAESLNQQSRGRVEALKLLRDELRTEVDRRLGPPRDKHTVPQDKDKVVVKQEPKSPTEHIAKSPSIDVDATKENDLGKRKREDDS